jgi:hypothetical protein
MTAAMTETWAEVVLCKASAIRIGQPKTAPAAVNAVGLHRLRGSLGALTIIISGIAMTAAITGRAKAVNSGSKLFRASLVKGSESEKAKIPRKAKRRPFRWVLLVDANTVDYNSE